MESTGKNNFYNSISDYIILQNILDENYININHSLNSILSFFSLIIYRINYG